MFFRARSTVSPQLCTTLHSVATASAVSGGTIGAARKATGPALLRKAVGFTLIELLVVIAIIALLLGILLPSLSAARESGRQVVCGNNMKQIYTAIFSYSLDFKDYHHAKRLNYGARFLRINPNGPYESSNLRLVRPYIPNFTSDGGPDDVAYWGAIYDPYFDISIEPTWYTARMPWTGNNSPPFGLWKLWRCPSAKLMDPYPDGTTFNPDHFYQTYGFNGVDDRRDPQTGKPANTWWVRRFDPRFGRQISQPTKVTDIFNPSGLIMFQDAFEHMLDANGDTLNDLTQYNGDANRGDFRFQAWNREYFRHGQGCNTVWGDGHVRTIATAENSTSLPWYTGYLSAPRP
jgi:prepilin-type N-terminal cleavage/methylation domain-containing protein/prepilin-type processing-associated H-X9-DG protein